MLYVILLAIALALAALAWRALRPPPDQQRAKDDARDAEARADKAADTQRAADVAKADAHADEQDAREPVDVANEWVREEWERGGR